MRLIDVDALKEKCFGKRGGLIHTSDVDNMPTIEIVRCRDCIYWHDIIPANLKGYQYCHAFRDMMPKGGYCHKAQRREGNE